MDLAAVMDEIGTQLDTIDGLRVYRYPPDNVQVPAAVVTYPETYTYDETFGRGMDRITVPVVVMVGKASDRASRDQLGAYADGSGDKSIKAVLESGVYAGFDSVRVTDVEFDVVSMAAVEHVAATFTLDIAGPGSEAPLVDYSSLNQFTPADHNLVAWAYDPVVTEGQTAAVAGNAYLVKLPLRGAVTPTSLLWVVGGAGVTPVAGQNQVGLYSSAGVRLASAVVDADVTSTGVKTTALAPGEIGPGFVWAAFLFNAATPPSLHRGSTAGATAQSNNVGLGVAAARWAGANTPPFTTLPASFSPAANFLEGRNYWAALT